MRISYKKFIIGPNLINVHVTLIIYSTYDIFMKNIIKYNTNVKEL